MDKLGLLRQINCQQMQRFFFDKGEYMQASILYVQAFDKDPLRYEISLNAAFSYYNSKDYINALKYFGLSIQSKNPETIQKGMRYKALTLLNLGDDGAACAEFIKLIGKFPKRMFSKNLINIVDEKVNEDSSNLLYRSGFCWWSNNVGNSPRVP